MIESSSREDEANTDYLALLTGLNLIKTGVDCGKAPAKSTEFSMSGTHAVPFLLGISRQEFHDGAYVRHFHLGIGPYPIQNAMGNYNWVYSASFIIILLLFISERVIEGQYRIEIDWSAPCLMPLTMVIVQEFPTIMRIDEHGSIQQLF